VESGIAADRALLERIAATSPNIVYVFDLRQRRVLYTNRRVVQDLGYTPAEVEAEGFSFLEQRMHPEDLERLEALLGRWDDVSDERVLEAEYRMRHKDGQWHWFVARDTAFARDEQGRVMQILGVAQDITERKLSEQRLRESEARYRTLVENAPEAIVILDATEGRFVDVNDNACRLFGHPRARMLELGPIELSPPLQPDGQPSRAKALGYIEQAIRGERPRFAWTHCDAGGRDIACEVRLVRMPMSDRVLIRGSIEDVTERQRAFETIRRSEQQLALHFQQTAVAVIEWDLEFRVRAWNRAAERIFGFTHQEAIGRHALELVVPQEVHAHVAGIWSELLQKRGGTRSRNENVTKDGRRIVCEWFNTPLVDAGGHVLGVASVAYDVTEAQQAEAALRASEANLKITLDAIGDGVIATDVEQRIVRMNPVAEQLTGWPLGEARGVPLGEVFFVVGPAPERPDHPARLRARDGREREIACSSSPIKAADGKVVGAVLVFRDVTEQRALELQLRQSEKLSAIGQLAGGIAHDFNNQMTAILGFAELLGEAVQDAEARGHVAQIRACAERSVSLTRQLLAFARGGSHERQPVDVDALVGEVSAILEHSVEKKIRITTQCAAGGTRILGDRGLLQSALLNLALNARDAMRHGGTLEFRTEVVDVDGGAAPATLDPLPAGRYLRVAVRDTGEGMSAETRRRLFEPFFTTKPPGKGTGLGLAAVYGTVKSHHGGIAVDSEPGRGSTFTLYLPVGSPSAAPESARAKDSPPAAARARILVVDDDGAVLEMVSRTLARAGHEVQAESDVTQALKHFAANADAIDLVWLDQTMPVFTGSELLSRMRQMRPGLRAILSSGYAAQEVLPAAGDGRTRYLAKPFSVSDLLRAVQGALRQAE
jgi:PAS domain S-box-containing protein